MAHAHVDLTKLKPGQHVISNRVKTICAVFMFLGLLTFGIGLMKSPERLWSSYLVSYFYFTSLSLGGLFFVAIQFMVKAGWSTTVRRFAESMTSFIPFVVLGAVVLLFGAKHLYIWLDAKVVAEDHVLTHKASYLNWKFFLVRLALFVSLWWGFAKVLVGNSLKMDQTGDSSIYSRNVKVAVAFILSFALSYSFFSVDLLMSLQPHWFSTIFGVYCFSGLFQSSLAMIILLAIYQMKKGNVRGFVNENHLHDLSKFMKAFTVFMAYIGFSQFMLIWYANIPEETEFYLHRAHGGWMAVSLAILFFKFVVPFVLLLPQGTKRDPARVGPVAVLILVMQFVDLFWLVYPNFSETVTFGFIEVGIFLGFLGGFLFCVHRFLAKNSLIPMKDPYLAEAVNHHVVF